MNCFYVSEIVTLRCVSDVQGTPYWTIPAVCAYARYASPTEAYDAAKRFAQYYACIAADDAFHDALVKVYGKRAGDMRYRSEALQHAAIAAAHQAWHEAGDAWRAEQGRIGPKK